MNIVIILTASFLIKESIAYEYQLEIYGGNYGIATSRLNRRVELDCRFPPNNDAVAELQWFDNHGKLVSNDKSDEVHVLLSENEDYYEMQYYQAKYQAVLVIRKAREEHQGTYTCKAQVSAEGNNFDIEKTVELQLLDDIGFTDTPLEQTLKAGSDGRVMCHVTGLPKPEVSWEYNGQRLQTGSGKYRQDQQGLLIKDATSKDSGEYACVAVSSHYYGYQTGRRPIKVHVADSWVDWVDSQLNH